MEEAILKLLDIQHSIKNDFYKTNEVVRLELVLLRN